MLDVVDLEEKGFLSPKSKKNLVLKGLIASDLLWIAQDSADKCCIGKTEAQGNLLANQLGIIMSYEPLGGVDSTWKPCD